MSTRTFLGIDHVVLRCHDVEATLRWYTDALGLTAERVDGWRAGTLPFPSVRVSAECILDLVPRPGDGDDAAADAGLANVDHICLVSDRATVEAIAADPAFELVGTPGVRSGARGDGWSVYVRDPDGTVVEIRHYEM